MALALAARRGAALVGQSSALRPFSVSSAALKKIPTMEQVEVDEKHVKDKLGPAMAFVKKAEKQNAQRAKKHVKYRRTDWIIGGTCIGMAIGIYGYTIYAMKQERFLDDFEMPDPLEEEDRTRGKL